MTLRTIACLPLIVCCSSLGCDAGAQAPSDHPDPPAPDGGATADAEDDEPDSPPSASPAAIGPAGTYAIDPPARSARELWAIDPVSFEATPPGCRIGDQPPPWSWELQDASRDTWSLIERVEIDGQARDQSYACSSQGTTFSCDLQTGFDYNTIGTDAKVSLSIVYDGTWGSDDDLTASFSLSFTCEGAACNTVAEQWAVTGFPCDNAGTLRGTRRQ